MTRKVLHIASCATFLPPFVEKINEMFGVNQHEFMLTSGIADNELKQFENVKLFKLEGLLKKIVYYGQLLYRMHIAKRIVIHGLFNQRLVELLFFFPWLLKKSDWVIWGGDLYSYKLAKRNLRWKIREFFRRPVIKNMANLVTYIKGDVENARQWYGARGKFYECLMYHSNLFKHYDIKPKPHNVINIQIGNSADPSNNHLEILEKLAPFRDRNIQLFAPLSYGNKFNAEKVINKGHELFGDKFVALTEVMSFKSYLEFLSSIDIAIFNHRRQQAMGNTITLLGLGKTVYLRSDTTQWELFKDKGILVRDFEELTDLDFDHNLNNIEKIKEHFSSERYHEQLIRLFS